MIGEKKSRRWAKKHGGRVLDEASPDKAVFTFWHTDVEEGHSTFLQLPWVALVGLQSMVRNGGFQAVYLLCFHRFENVPDGVKVKLLDNKTDFDMALHAMSVQWANRRGIAALSDILRLRACQASPHSMNIVCDVDTLFLSSADPRTFLGHWFGTHAQNPTSLENFNAPQRRAKLLVEYCKDPEDMLKAVCPFGFPSKSKMLAALLNYLEEVLAGIVSGVGIVPRAYDFPMQAVARFVMEHGLREAYLPATVFSSLPYYAWGKPLLASSLCQRQWGIKALQALPRELAPIAVNAFWQSTNTEDGPVKRWDPKCVESGSTWSALMELAGIPKVHTGNVVECIADAVHDLAPNVWLPRTLPRLRMSTKGKESRFYHEIILNCSLTILCFLRGVDCLAFAAVVGIERIPLELRRVFTFQHQLIRSIRSPDFIHVCGLGGLSMRYALSLTSTAWHHYYDNGRGCEAPPTAITDQDLLVALVFSSVSLHADITDVRAHSVRVAIENSSHMYDPRQVYNVQNLLMTRSYRVFQPLPTEPRVFCF